MTTEPTIIGEPPIDPERSLAAARANAAGSLWGQRFNNLHITYRHQRRAFIDQHNLPTRPVGGKKGGPRTAGGVLRKVIGGAPVDFSGSTAGRIFLAIELKSSSSDKGSLSIDDRGIRFEQLDELNERRLYGQNPVLLWVNDGVVGVLSSPGWVDRVLQLHAGTHPNYPKRKSIPRDWFVWLAPGDLDWLAVIEKEATR